MSSKKIIHYNLDNIDKIGARFNLIYGERSNGKSYQVKHKKGVEKYLKTGKRFILMRRWKEEISSEKIEQYFSDVDVAKLTNNKYNCITTYRKCLYLSIYDNETGKTKRYDKIGYVVALSTEQNYAGASYLDVEDIIFEEFMSRSVYVGNNESSKLMNFYATVDRKRLTTRLWLVGNTISRVCPYINDWGLHNVISSQKQGTIKTININVENDEPITIAIEYCKSTGISSGTIGTNANMINTGAWETSPQPHLPKSYNNYKCLYRFGFQYKGFKFLSEYLQDKDTKEVCWFIRPFYKDFSNKIIIFSDEIKISPYWQRDIYNISIRNERLKNLFNTFKENKIFYSSDLCGTDFKQVIDFQIRR